MTASLSPRLQGGDTLAASSASRDARRTEAVPAVTERGRVLVMGDDTRGFLATVRSLGRRGVEVHAAPFDFRAPALSSRYVSAVHDIPPWMGDGQAWQTAMRALLETQRFDLVIPCDERNLLPMHLVREQFAGLTRFAIPNGEAIDALFDKHSTRELAERVGVAIARGRVAQPGEDAGQVLAEFGAPVVVKPRRSYTIDGLAKRGRVHLVSDRAALQPLLDEAEPDSLLVESCFEGRGLGLSILAHRGRLLQAFEHHRVHERSGSSFYRISAPPNPELVEACAAMTAGVDFTGIAMFEFKQNERGEWILLEVNARPWGSLPLPVALGVEFPYRWYRLLVHGEETPPMPYRVGVYGRNLIPDLIAALADAQANGHGRVGRSLALGWRMLGLRRMLLDGEREDLFVADDRAPAYAQLNGLLSGGVGRAARAVPGGRALNQRQARARVRDAAQQRPTDVLFACQGNICRSPYAAALLQHMTRDDPRIVVRSGGMMPRNGRPVPDLFQRHAESEGVALAEHRSAWLDRAAASSASLIVLFDRVNVAAVSDRYPELRDRIVLLGHLTGVGEIDDPVDGDAAVVAATYAQIRRAVEELHNLLTLSK